MYFSYGEAETDYLKQRDRRLADVIDSIGHICRKIDPDLFSSVVHQIVGQQIQTKALDTIWGRIQAVLGAVNAQTVSAATRDELQSLGISYRKADYIREFADRVQNGSFDLDGLSAKSDADAIAQLTTLRGVGVWTAEMILLFCLQRPDIFSYDDLALRRGLCMVYRHRAVDRDLFEKYRRRYSPCGSVASLYLWAVAGGALQDRQKDTQQKQK